MAKKIYYVHPSETIWIRFKISDDDTRILSCFRMQTKWGFWCQPSDRLVEDVTGLQMPAAMDRLRELIYESTTTICPRSLPVVPRSP